MANKLRAITSSARFAVAEERQQFDEQDGFDFEIVRFFTCGRNGCKLHI